MVRGLSQLEIDDLHEDNKESLRPASSLKIGGYESGVLSEAMRLCTKGQKINTGKLELVASKMCGWIAMRGGQLLFGQASRADSSQGFTTTALQNLTMRLVVWRLVRKCCVRERLMKLV